MRIPASQRNILIILAIVKQHEHQIPYQIRFSNGQPVVRGLYKIPDMVLCRKSVRQTAATQSTNKTDRSV